MSKSLFKISRGLAHVITTGEPVFVKTFTTSGPLSGETEEVAIVVRPVATQDGISYRKEEIPIEELETPFGLVKRKIAYDEYLQKAREESQAKMYDLPPTAMKMLQEAQAQKPLNSGVN